MNWWIGFCWAAGSLCFAALDYRAREQAGKRWLSEWPWRLVTYFALGGVFAAIGYAPIFVYHFGEALAGLYNHPPTLSMFLALLVLAVAVLIAIEFLKLASRTVREIGSSQQGLFSTASVCRIAGASVLFIAATVVLGAGSLGSRYVLLNH